jgi:glycosyltransferase involved in cell wall biosynthesis
MEQTIKISIVTPSFNQGRFIEQTILSVLNQTYKNIEYIVVDGGSTDNTMEIVNKYKDKIDIIISEKDKGQSDAINKGFRLSTGVLAGWINSDDVLYPDCVKNLVIAYSENSRSAIYYCPYLDNIKSNGEWIQTGYYPILDKKYLITFNSAVCQPCSFYNNEILKKINYLNENIHYCMDLDLWLRLLDHGGIYPFAQTSQGAIRRWENTKTASKQWTFFKEIQHTVHKYGGEKYGLPVRRLFYQIIRQKLSCIIKKAFFANEKNKF